MKFDKMGTSPGYLIESLSRNMRRFSADILKKNDVGLTLEQFAVLMVLSDHGPKHQAEIAEIMSKDNPTLTRILDLLEKKELLNRETSPDDRRKFLLVLTKKGKAKIDATHPLVIEIRNTLFGGFTSDQLDQLLEIKALIEANISAANKS
ncbi:MarR family winged helix-turn-helix transcriptional regulator [Ekhidna sp.]